MPQTHFTLGDALGKAVSGGFSNQAYDQGLTAGIKDQGAIATARKTAAEAQAAQRQIELQSDESILATALQAAGINSEDMPKFKNYMARGTIAEPQKLQTGIDVQSILGGALKDSAPAGREDYTALLDPKPVASAPDMTPQQRQQYDMAVRSIAAMRQALMQGDKSTTNATETTLANLRASGAGNNNTTLAQLLMHGKPQFDGQATGVTDVLTGEQSLNDIGRSQIVENNAQAQKAATGGKAPSDEFKSVRDDIRSDYNAMYPISSLNGKRPKGAPDFNAFTRDWLKQYNIPEKSFFNGDNPIATPDPQPAPESRFASDPAMKGNKAGKMVQGKGVEVFNSSGKLIGYYK